MVMTMTIKTISLAGEPGRPYLWHELRKGLLEQIEPGSFDVIRIGFSDMSAQLSELDRQIDVVLCNELLNNIDEEDKPY